MNDAHGENERRKDAAETSAAQPSAQAPKLQANSYDPLIVALIVAARFLGLVQRTLGRGQTHLLAAAKSLGWKPGPVMYALALEKRQAELAAREIFREGQRIKRKRAKQLRRQQGKGKGRARV